LSRNWTIVVDASTEGSAFQDLTTDQHFWIISMLETNIGKWTEIFNFTSGRSPFSIPQLLFIAVITACIIISY